MLNDEIGLSHACSQTSVKRRKVDLRLEEHPLYPAISKGDLNEVLRLLESGASIWDGYGMSDSALHFAGKKGMEECFAALLSKCDKLPLDDLAFQSIFEISLENLSLRSVAEVWEKLSERAKREELEMRAGMAIAVSSGESDLEAKKKVSCLSKLGFAANVMNERYSRSIAKQPISLAVRLGFLETSKELLKMGALVECANGASSPLHEAAIGGSAECVMELLAVGARTDCLDGSEMYPLEVALSWGNAAAAAALLMGGAELTKRAEGLAKLHGSRLTEFWKIREKMSSLPRDEAVLKRRLVKA